MTVLNRSALRPLAAAILFALAAAAARGAEGALEKMLLTADGTIYSVQAGLAVDLGVAADHIAPNDFVIEWVEKRQDGSRQIGLIPGAANRNPKSDLALAYDERSGTLVLLWNEHFGLQNDLRLALLRAGGWETAEFRPLGGISQAHNPQMLLTRSTVRYEDPDGAKIAESRSVLHLAWWEEGSRAQARYAPIFLDETLDGQELRIYDLASEVGGGRGPTNLAGVPPGAYLFPALQADGSAGDVLATFADMTGEERKHLVVRIGFPENPITKQRRRIPVLGVAGKGPIAKHAASSSGSLVRTVVGASYQPTLYWQDKDAVRFTRFDGKEWNSVKSIALDEEMTYEKAARLVEEMGKRN